MLRQYKNLKFTFENDSITTRLVYFIQYIFWCVIFFSIAFVLFEDTNMEAFRYIGF